MTHSTLVPGPQGPTSRRSKNSIGSIKTSGVLERFIPISSVSWHSKQAATCASGYQEARHAVP
jgi:hypothetical protein